MTAKVNASVALLALGVAMASGSVMAYQKGDVVVRAGIATAAPDESSSELRLNGGSVPGTGVEVDDDTQLGLTLTYMLTDKIAIGVLGATPFSHTVTAYGLADALALPDDTADVADVKHLPPTFSIQYFPLSADAAFQPYAGIGLNYTFFFDETLASDIKGILGDGSIELDDSFGLAFELGCDYQINENWVLNAAVWKIDIDTTATIKFDSGNKVEADVNIDPLAYMVGIGYKF